MQLIDDASVTNANAIRAEVGAHCESKISLEENLKSLIPNRSKNIINSDATWQETERERDRERKRERELTL